MRKTRKSVSTKKEISQCKTLKEKQEDFIMLPTVDFCFKELMQNDNIRKNIIAALLNVPSGEVENTELMPTILRKESKDDKYGILDVRVKLKNGEQIDFEMQVEAFDCWANRSVYYLSKMYTSEIKEGEGYDCLKKCIHVSILAYDHFLDDKECYRRIAFCDAKTGKEYTDLMEMHILELLKLPPEEKNETKEMQVVGGSNSTDEGMNKINIGGIDGITKEEYRRNLEENINTLIEDLKKKSYKPKTARLVEMAISKKREQYDRLTAELEELHKKQKAIQSEELLKAIERSSKS